MLAISLPMLLSACDWVDSKGVQSDNAQLDRTVVTVKEEQQSALDLTAWFPLGTDHTQAPDWSVTHEGMLAECSNLPDYASSGESLEDACSPLESNCEVYLLRPDDGDPTRYQISTPQLSSPVGLRYQWEIPLNDTGSTSKDLTLCIQAINTAPVAYPDTFTLQQGETLVVAGAVQGNDCDIPEGSKSLLANDLDDRHLKSPSCLRAEMVTAPRFANNDVGATFDENGGFTYTAPYPANQPTDQFSYRISDTLLDSAPATVSVTIIGNATRPNAVNNSHTVRRNTRNNRFNVLNNDNDPLGTDLTIVSIPTAPNRGGSVQIVTGSHLLYTPRRNYTGTETFEYRIRNDWGQTDTALVSVRVSR